MLSRSLQNLDMEVVKRQHRSPRAALRRHALAPLANLRTIGEHDATRASRSADARRLTDGPHGLSDPAGATYSLAVTARHPQGMQARHAVFLLR